MQWVIMIAMKIMVLIMEDKIINKYKKDTWFSTSQVSFLSKIDLVEELPEIKSFSPRNLQYMNQFYRLHMDIEIAHQLDAQVFIKPNPGTINLTERPFLIWKDVQHFWHR